VLHPFTDLRPSYFTIDKSLSAFVPQNEHHLQPGSYDLIVAIAAFLLRSFSKRGEARKEPTTHGFRGWAKLVNLLKTDVPQPFWLSVYTRRFEFPWDNWSWCASRSMTHRAVFLR
jgi:hypothetical protein